jgi:DNA-binding PadR family transcriptional regulator
MKQRNSRVVDGKVRKYYTITEQGLEVLKEAGRKVGELTEEVLDEGDE